MRIFRKLAQLLDVDLASTPPADGDALTYDSGSEKWVPAAGGGGGGAPTDANYLVGTANAGLSAEIAVGTTPGGELGGTWASPTVDATHSGSSHASVQAAAEATAAAALSTHSSDTTGVHGIADTSALLDTGDIGNSVQAFDADLSTWAGLTPSAFFQTLVDDADAATARATLGVIASLFQSGGAQAIKLDDLAAPDDNTDLNVSTSKHGLAPKLPNDATKFLDGTGAYSTPAGGGSFSVLDVPGLIGWWDASDAASITSSGGAVSQWNDKSGNGFHVVQATAGNKPTTGTRTINSLNVLDFDGGDVLAKSSSFYGSANGIYVVLEPDTVSGTDLIVHSGAAGVADWSFFLNGGVPSFFGGSGSVTSGTLSTGVPVLLAFRLGSLGGFARIRNNGTYGGGAVPGTPGYANLEIGADNSPTNFFDGKIAEVILVGSIVGGGHDSDIRSYLAAKWGVTA
jgi:hypothetical protein